MVLQRRLRIPKRMSNSGRPDGIEDGYIHGANAFVLKDYDLDKYSKSLEGVYNFWGNVTTQLRSVS